MRRVLRPLAIVGAICLTVIAAGCTTASGGPPAPAGGCLMTKAGYGGAPSVYINWNTLYGAGKNIKVYSDAACTTPVLGVDGNASAFATVQGPVPSLPFGYTSWNQVPAVGAGDLPAWISSYSQAQALCIGVAGWSSLPANVSMAVSYVPDLVGVANSLPSNLWSCNAIDNATNTVLLP